jgi:hypothetical protein
MRSVTTGTCYLRDISRTAANFSDGDRFPSASWTVHSAAGDPATLRAARPLARAPGEGGTDNAPPSFHRHFSASRTYRSSVFFTSHSFKRSFDNEASIEMIDKGVAEAGHPIDGALTVAHAFWHFAGPPKKRALARSLCDPAHSEPSTTHQAHASYSMTQITDCRPLEPPNRACKRSCDCLPPSSLGARR